MPDKAAPQRGRGKLLRKFRKQYRITLTEFGKLAGLSQPMLSQFERGDHNLSDEAWMRVLQTISDLIIEDNTKRLAEVGKAKETAAKLGAPGLIFGFAFKTNEQITKEQAEIDAERIRLKKAGEISALIVEQTDGLLPHLKENALAFARENPEKVLQEYSELWRLYDELRVAVRQDEAKRRELEARGYALFLKSDVEAKDQRIADLEEQLRRRDSE
jgi:transcriptional regulator with XRE-family HTH domain